MADLNLAAIFTYMIGALGVMAMVSVFAMIFWYVKVKPDFEFIKNNLEKKAAAEEVEKIRLELERKREYEKRIDGEIKKKQDAESCELLRKGCAPLLDQSIKNLGEKIEEISKKIDHWMCRRREEVSK